MFLIDKKISADKPLTLRSITKYGNVLLQFTTARLITNYGDVLLQFTIAWLLQFSTTVITVYDRYYNLRRLLLQFTTGITVHDVITTHDGTDDTRYLATERSSLVRGRVVRGLV